MAISDNDVRAMGFSLPVGTDLIRNGDDEISKNARAAAEGIRDARWKKGVIPNGSEIREYMYGKDGQFTSLTASNTATMTGLPDELAATPWGFTAVAETLGNGTTITLTDYNVFSTSRWVCTSAPSTGDGWSRWNKVKWDTGENESKEPAGSSGSGFKTLPLILTAGRGGGEAMAPQVATVEYDVNLSSSIHVSRYRFAIRDGNPRWGTSTAQAISLTNISFGGVAKLSSMTTSADGEITFSRWFTGDFGNLKFDYSAPQAPRYIIGGGRLNGTRRTEMPFELWIECEVPVGTPAIGLVGDSNSVAVNATIPIHDAWMQQYCRPRGFFPVLYGHSGDGMVSSGDPTAYKFTRWDHLARPDVVVHANGANDLPSTEGGITLDEMKDRARAEWAMSGEKISKNRHVALIKSRASGVNNSVRLGLNSWYKTFPEPVREWHDIASPVTAGDTGGLLPQYISSDGIHMTTAGHTAIANALNKVMTMRESLVFDQTAGRVVKAWDYLNNREQLIYGDTGARLLANDPAATTAAGSILLRRTGHQVEIFIHDKVTVGSGNLQVAVIPEGFRPYQWVNETMSAVYDTTINGVRIASSGAVTVFGVAAGDTMRGHVTWTTTEPWPTSLPGTALGSIPA